MSEPFAIFLMINNYLHDVATALLAASGFVVWLLSSEEISGAEPGAGRSLLVIYSKMTRLAWFSLAWIILGGIPRVVYYRDFEWASMAGKGQVAALIVKHIFAFMLVGAGAAIWFRVKRRLAGLVNRQERADEQ